MLMGVSLEHVLPRSPGRSADDGVLRPIGTFSLILGVLLSPSESATPSVNLPRILRTVALTALGLVLVLGEPAVADRSDRFHDGRVYRGSFPDPDVVRAGKVWVAAGTTVARRSLPMMTSTDGRTWRARRGHGAGRARTNDGMVGAPTWAASHRAGRRRFVKIWAPAIGRAANGSWLVAYAAPLRGKPHKRCIGIATAPRPLGPYRNQRRRPIVCPRHEGAIDPDLFRSGGRTYLLWKTSGIWGKRKTAIRVRALRRDGGGFRPGSRAHTLLRTASRWEGAVIENPSMIRHRGRLYLFYSGNRWYDHRYATGYAVCRSILGPCRRPLGRPLLASGRGVAGPGGASALRGPRGRLLLAYAAWPAGRIGSARRLHVAQVRVRRGRLLAHHHWRPRRTTPRAAPAPAVPPALDPPLPVASAEPAPTPGPPPQRGFLGGVLVDRLMMTIETALAAVAPQAPGEAEPGS